MTANHIDMTNKEGLFKNLCIFIAPIMLTGILQLLYTASDLIICGTFGPANSTGAISATSSLINLIVNSFLGLAVGSNVLMARCFGADDGEKGQKVVYTSMALSVIIGIGVGTFGALFSRYFLVWMNTPHDIIDLSTQYLAIYFIGVPFTVIYNFGASLLRATGDTRKPFYFLALSGLANVLLNLLFVIVFDMGVAGVAICTAISQFLAAGMVVGYLLIMKNGFFRFNLRQLRFHKRETIEIIRIGLPAGLQGMIFSLSNVIIQAGINSLGSDVVNGNGASASLEGFAYIAMNACAQGAVTFASANFGAKNKENIKRAILYCILLSLGVWFILSGATLLARIPLLKLYGINEIAVEAGEIRLIIVLATYFLCGIMEIYANALRAIGYSVLPMLISLVGVCGSRLLWMFLVFPIPYFNNLEWISISFPISWTLTAATHFAFFTVLFKRLKFDNAQPEKLPDETESTAEGT